MYPGSSSIPTSLDANTRIDVAALDGDDVTLTVEVERPTNDLRTGVPADFDAMAACDPNAAVWIVANRELGHRIVEILVGDHNEDTRLSLTPADVKSPTTPLERYDLQAPGCTAIRTLSAVTTDFFERQVVE